MPSVFDKPTTQTSTTQTRSVFAKGGIVQQPAPKAPVVPVQYKKTNQLWETIKQSPVVSLFTGSLGKKITKVAKMTVPNPIEPAKNIDEALQRFGQFMTGTTAVSIVGLTQKKPDLQHSFDFLDKLVTGKETIGSMAAQDFIKRNPKLNPIVRDAVIAGIGGANILGNPAYAIPFQKLLSITAETLGTKSVIETIPKQQLRNFFIYTPEENPTPLSKSVQNLIATYPDKAFLAKQAGIKITQTTPNWLGQIAGVKPSVSFAPGAITEHTRLNPNVAREIILETQKQLGGVSKGGSAIDMVAERNGASTLGIDRPDLARKLGNIDPKTVTSFQDLGNKMVEAVGGANADPEVASTLQNHLATRLKMFQNDPELYKQIAGGDVIQKVAKVSQKIITTDLAKTLTQRVPTLAVNTVKEVINKAKVAKTASEFTKALTTTEHKEIVSNGVMTATLFKAVKENNPSLITTQTTTTQPTETSAQVAQRIEKKDTNSLLQGLLEEAKKYNNVKEFVKKNTLYHGTSEGAARSIQREGELKIGQAIGSEKTGYGKELFFADNPTEALSYGQRKSSENYLLRVKKTNEFIPDTNVVAKGDFKFGENIPIDDIEIQMPNGKWTPIKNYDFYDKKAISPGLTNQIQSQLTDIWNKAHGEQQIKTVEIKPAEQEQPIAKPKMEMTIDDRIKELKKIC